MPSMRVESASTPLALVSLPWLMAKTTGTPSVNVGLIDGPISEHLELKESNIRHLRSYKAPPREPDTATLHGTAVAGLLVGSRATEAPGVCPGVTLLSCPVLTPRSSRAAASPAELADAIVETTNAGARVINMSLALSRGRSAGRSVEEALDYAAGRGVIVVVASGNDGSIDGTALTRHQAVIPVVAYDLQGFPARFSNLGHSSGQRGVGAPGEGIVSLRAGGGLRPFGGSSAAAAVVTGAIALLWSEFPRATRDSVLYAVARSAPRRRSVIPPLLNVWQAYERLLAAQHSPQEVQRG
ncbi:S8 family peptidase [Streptomyces sp. NPDC004980]